METHCNFLPHIAGVIAPDLSISKRCIGFIKSAINSDNIVVKTIANMGITGLHSIMGGGGNHRPTSSNC